MHTNESKDGERETERVHRGAKRKQGTQSWAAAVGGRGRVGQPSLIVSAPFTRLLIGLVEIKGILTRAGPQAVYPLASPSAPVFSPYPPHFSRTPPAGRLPCPHTFSIFRRIAPALAARLFFFHASLADPSSRDLLPVADGFLSWPVVVWFPVPNAWQSGKLHALCSS